MSPSSVAGGSDTSGIRDAVGWRAAGWRDRVVVEQQPDRRQRAGERDGRLPARQPWASPSRPPASARTRRSPSRRPTTASARTHDRQRHAAAPPPPPPPQTVTLTVTATGRSGERVASTPAGISVTRGQQRIGLVRRRHLDHPAGRRTAATRSGPAPAPAAATRPRPARSRQMPTQRSTPTCNDASEPADWTALEYRSGRPVFTRPKRRR